MDEIEKAHPDVANILLQVLDDGRITDSQGRLVNFTNTVIIMTSNIGSSYLLQGLDDTENHAAEDLVMAELSRHFKPELLNRMDDIIIFHSLKADSFRLIARKMLEDLVGRLKGQEVGMTYSDDVLDWIVAEGTDADFGARPLKRFIQRHVETVVAKELIKGELGQDGKLLLTMENGNLHVNKS